MYIYPDASAVVRDLSPDEPVILNRPHAAARAARFFAEKFPGKSLYAVKANPSPDLLRVMVMHQNLLRGEISERMGLAHWRRAWRQVMATGVDLVLCGHDHQEGAGALPNGAVVATSGTHTSRTRGGRPSACNLITADAETITVEHRVWDVAAGRFTTGAAQAFARPRLATTESARDW